MYKSKLQELCHEKKWGLPRYTAMKDGPDHNPCFQASVSVNGFSFDSPIACKSSKQAQNQAAMAAFLHFTSPPSSSPVDEQRTLESPELFNSTLKEAENAASEAASMSMSLSTDGFQDDEPGHLYKNLLQELAQREGLSMPAYTTVNSGASHMPTFSSTVDVEGEKFCGNTGKSKKQAEMSAAKVAYITLKERALKTTQSANWTMDVDEQDLVSSPTIKNKECSKEIKVQGSDDVSDNINLKAADCNAPDALLLEMDKMNKIGKSSSCSERILYSTEESPSPPAFKQNDLSAVSISDKNEVKSRGLKSYLLCNRFRVYTQFPDIAFPNCITVLPISDDKWVAVRLEFPNKESN